jgi:hypothetical protein
MRVCQTELLLLVSLSKEDTYFGCHGARLGMSVLSDPEVVFWTNEAIQ